MKVVIVDDDTLHLEFLVLLLRRAGYEAVGFRAGRDRATPRPLPPNVFAPEIDGGALLRHIRALFPGVPVVSVGGGQPSFTAGEFCGRKPGRLIGADVWLGKPVDPAELLHRVAEFES